MNQALYIHIASFRLLIGWNQSRQLGFIEFQSGLGRPLSEPLPVHILIEFPL